MPGVPVTDPSCEPGRGLGAFAGAGEKPAWNGQASGGF